MRLHQDFICSESGPFAPSYILKIPLKSSKMISLAASFFLHLEYAPLIPRPFDSVLKGSH